MAAATFTAPFPVAATAAAADGEALVLAGCACLFGRGRAGETHAWDVALIGAAVPPVFSSLTRRKGTQVGLAIAALEGASDGQPLGHVRQELYVASRWDIACIDWNPHAAQRQWIATAVRLLRAVVAGSGAPGADLGRSGRRDRAFSPTKRSWSGTSTTRSSPSTRRWPGIHAPWRTCSGGASLADPAKGADPTKGAVPAKGAVRTKGAVPAKRAVRVVLTGRERTLFGRAWSSPTSPTLLATCAVDGSILVWDMREPPSKPAQSYGTFAGPHCV